MRLLYIFSGNLSTTPRALQSIIAASKKYKVEVVFVNRATTWAEIDKRLLEDLELEGKSVSIKKEFTFNWFFLSVLYKLVGKLSFVLDKHIALNAFANKATLFLYFALIKRKSNYDLVIGHSYGSLYPAFAFSKKNNIPFAFDIEDYHPGEKCSPAEKQRRELLMRKLLPKAAYVSYASPLIGQYSADLLSKKSEPKMKTVYIRAGARCISMERCNEVVEYETYSLPENFLINNSFSEKEFQLGENNSKKIQFVWFSQNIAAGRGLELIIPALYRFKEQVHLTLIGNLYQEFEESFLKNYTDFIDFRDPLPQKELNLHLCHFDIGLAIELSTADFNRDICLTNKIFAYTQAGLFLMATDTSAQKQFIEEHNEKCGFDSLRLRSVTTAQPAKTGLLSKAEMTGIGLLTPQSTEEMEKAIEKIIKNIDEIRANKKLRFEYAKRLAWENEGQKLLTVWDKLLQL